MLPERSEKPFGEALADVAIEKGISFGECARIMGISEVELIAEIEDIEEMGREAEKYLIAKAKFFGVSLERLIEVVETLMAEEESDLAHNTPVGVN